MESEWHKSYTRPVEQHTWQFDDIKKISVEELNANLSAVLEWVDQQKLPCMILLDEKPIAMLVPVPANMPSETTQTKEVRGDKYE